MNIGSLLRRASHVAGDRIALFSGERPVASFRTLEARAAALAAALTAQVKLARGDRVLLFAFNCPEYIETLFACWFAGLTAVPVNARLHTRELSYIIKNTAARVCFSSPQLLETASAAANQADSPIRVLELGSADLLHMTMSQRFEMVDTDADEIAWLFYTSGTTGNPKGAMLTHRNLMTMMLAYLVDVDQVQSGDAIIHAAPMSHGSGLLSLPYLAAGASQVVPVSGGFDPQELWDLLRVHTHVSLFAAPTMLDRLVSHGEKCDVPVEHLKSAIVGGAPFYAEDAKRAIKFLGAKVTQIYGQGESPMTISVLPAKIYSDTGHPHFESRIASVGFPHSVVQVRVGDGDGNPCSYGIVGEVLVKGDMVMKGYWHDPVATTETLRDGWLHTGDLGLLEPEGFLTLKGRSKELIISGGSNIYPREIEDVILLHPSIAEVAVVGRRHPQWGEEVVAFVVPKDAHSIDASELDAWCLEHVTRYKRPRHYRIIDSLPKNAYGKVLKKELVTWLEGSDLQGR